MLALIRGGFQLFFRDIIAFIQRFYYKFQQSYLCILSKYTAFILLIDYMFKILSSYSLSLSLSLSLYIYIYIYKDNVVLKIWVDMPYGFFQGWVFQYFFGWFWLVHVQTELLYPLELLSG
jgi:hypothetical protein